MNPTELLRARTGPLTRELLLAPAGFGLGQVPAGRTPDATVPTVCGYCSTGCGLTAHLRDGEAIGLSPATDYPVNLGMACPKGWEALGVLDAEDRATVPLLRNAAGRLEPVGWDRALAEFVSRFRAIQSEHGPESVAFLSTGQIVTEELAFLGALAKFGMGLRHGDGNTRQCMATSVVAYKQAFGFDAPPYTYADLEQSDVLVFVGSNPCIAHPILWERVLRNPHRPEIVVVDPRTTETAMHATQHLPVRPKADLALLYGVARILVERGAVDRDFVAAHTSGFDEFAAFVRAFDLPRTSAETGLSPAQIERFADTIARGERVSFWWTMGVNQSHQGVRTAQALVDLALLTGHVGRPGTGPNSITGQCNAMGSRLFSNTASLLGGRDFADANHRAEVARILDIDPARIPDDSGWTYERILEGVLSRKIRGLWIVCTNTAHSWINQNHARDVLDRLDFLVVQDMYRSTETARHAHLVLPAAGWAEKDGTFINSERRIGRVRQVRRAPGQALSDFRIFRLVAEAWGCGPMFARWTSPEAVFHLLRELSRGRPCDFTGIDDLDLLDKHGGIQWPFPDKDRPDLSAAANERRLFADGRFFHPDGRARFLFEEPRPLPEPADDAFPFTLLTGRGTAAQWHTQTRTGKSPALRRLSPARVWVEVHPADAARLGIRPDDTAVVATRRGRLRARVFVTPTVPAGCLFLPMHYAETNTLTDAVFDPYSRQPAYKACAASLHRA